MSKQLNTSWGGVADWYGELLAKEGTYQKEVILPNLLRLMQIKKGEMILDIGCGTGFFSRAFAEAGAEVVGVDVGKELIAKAREQKNAHTTYYVASADDMPVIKNNSAAKAVIVLALQNIENANGAISEAARCLTSNGRLFVVLNHPSFRIPQASEWGYDEKKKVQYRRLDSYISESKVAMQMHPGSDPSDITWSFHRPLQFYFKLFSKHGLAVNRLEEWVSHTKTPHGPRAMAENRARAEFPLFLCLEITKIS